MKKATIAILSLCAVAAAFLAGAWYSRRSVASTVQAVHADGGAGGGHASAPGGAITVPAGSQQLIGVRLGTVERAPREHALRLFGRVAQDETRVYRIHAGVDGSIGHVAPVTTGSRVRKDQLLATFYAPEAAVMMRYYLVARGTSDRYSELNRDPASRDSDEIARAPTSLVQRIQQLENMGMSALQREELVRERVVPETIKLYAPADGFVLARNVSPGLKFVRGKELYRIADLRRVWILADVREHEVQYIRPGMVARVSLPSQGKTLTAKVAEVLPRFDRGTRTLRVRLEANNPDHALWPEMLVDVTFLIELPPASTVPADAIVDSGLRKTVFVDRGNGRFEPRAVETGWRFGDTVEIVRGLEPGERIVVSGAFLVDSESRLDSAVPRVDGAPGDEKQARRGPQDPAMRR